MSPASVRTAGKFRTCESRILQQIAGAHDAIHRQGHVNKILADVFWGIVTHVSRTRPKGLEVVAVLFQQHVRDGSPQPDLAHGIGNHELIAARVSQAIEVRKFFALVIGESLERITASAWLGGVDDALQLSGPS